MKTPPSLELVEEHRIHSLLPEADSAADLEASGVLVRDGRYHVVFDNLSEVGRIDAGLAVTRDNTLVETASGAEGYEDIAFNPSQRRFYLLREACEEPDGTFRGHVVVCDERFRFLEDLPIDHAFDDGNKGFEGLVCVERGGREVLLALCEGNRCKSGRKGREPGGGRVHALERSAAEWKPVGTLKLPKTLAFEDYSAIDLRGDRVAVVSQASSGLWVGTLHPEKWRCADDGQVYTFPRSGKGKVRYGNVEGVGWVDDHVLVVVSDRRKKKQPKRFRHKEQSLHVFRLPGPA